MTSDCNFSCCICQKSGFHSDKNQQELLQSSTTEAAGRGGMLDGVFYSGNRRCLRVNDGGRRGRPSAALGWRGISRFSSQPGRRSKPSWTSDSGCCRHLWAAASQTLHSPTLPPLVSPLIPHSPALPPRFLSSPLPPLFVPISRRRMLFQHGCTS